MESLYNRSAPKRATNLSVNEDLLRQARELEINLSQAREQHLAEVVAQRGREQRLAENRPAIEHYNERVGRRGVFSDRIRRF